MDDLASQLKDIKEQSAPAADNASAQSLIDQPSSLQYSVKAGTDTCDKWDIRINPDGIAIDTSAFTIADLMKGMQHSARLLGIDKSLAMDTMTESQRQNALRWRTQDETIAKSFLNVYSEVQDTLDTNPGAVTSSDSSNYVMICLHNFFICFYPWAPCFHKPTFMAKLANPADHTSSFRLLILAICAYNASHALGFHEAEYPWNRVNDMTRSGQSFYVAARKILPDIILDDAPDVWTIVALHYLSVFCLDKSKSRSMHYHSLAVRMAIQQGYNSRDRGCSDATDLEIGRRLWWTLMLFQDVLDWTGYTDGELKALKETSIDFPSPLPDEEEPTAEALGFYVHFIQKIMKHNGMHQGFIEKQKKFCFGQGSQSPVSDGKSVSPISPELEFVDMEWRGHLPESTRNTMNCALQVVQQFTELTFHKRRILEAQLKADTQVLKQAMDDCINTANALVHTFEDCYGNQLTHFNNVMELWHASIMSVVCAILLNSADEGQPTASEQHQHLERLLQIFKDISFSRTSELNLDRIRDHNPAWDKFNSVLIAQGIVKQM
ncbi:lactose regulatory protein lac9 and GAL4-like protein [Umbelopsis sp. WA50703]